MTRKPLAFRLMHDARTAAELAHVRPAYAAGIRAAIATVAPLVLVAALPGGGASWVSLAGLNGALSDRGGPYRTKAALMSTLALCSAAAAFIGAMVARHAALAVIVAFALAMACGLARAWSDVGPGFGVAILVTFAISLAVPTPSIELAAARAGYIAAGGLWAMVLAVVLWPVRPYRPVRLRITECYRSIARYLEAAANEVTSGRAYDPWTLTSYQVAVRTAIEAARVALAAARRGHAGESGRGERLLVLHEIADQIYVHVIALLEDSDTAATASPPARDSFAMALTSMADVLRAIGTAIESERDLPRIAVSVTGSSLRPFDAALAATIDRIAAYETTAADLAASLNRGGATVVAADTIDIAEPPPEPVLFSLRAVLRPSSVILHHALRVAIVTAIAVLITQAFRLNHGYWVTLTAVVILQPFAATTRQKALQRVAGTIVGGIVAAALSAVFHGAIAVLILVGVFTLLCVALLPLNYGAYAVFGTPAFVLLAEVSVGDWHLAGLRIVNTLIGGALALAGARLLWPGDERSRLPELAAAALRANDALLRCALTLLADGRPRTVGPLRDARRDVAYAAAEAEDSLQRMMSDHRAIPEAIEPAMTILIYVRRVAASTAALVVTSAADRAPAAELKQFEEVAHDALADMADALAHSRAPKPLPNIGAAVNDLAVNAPVTHQRLVRLGRQIRLLHRAVARWASPAAESA